MSNVDDSVKVLESYINDNLAEMLKQGDLKTTDGMSIISTMIQARHTARIADALESISKDLGIISEELQTFNRKSG